MRAVLAAALCLAPSTLVAADLVLVDKGQPPVPIVVPKDAPARTREAAATLAGYIGKISGAKPAVVEGGAVPPRAIWVGAQPAVKALFPKTDFEFKHPEEVLLAANESHVVIAGRDRGAPQEYGTVNAVHTFLQDRLGVRWLWPGELGEEVEKRDRIALAPFEYRYHPQVRSRGDVFRLSALGSKGPYGRSHEWVLRQRMQLDSLRMPGGHSFTTWWDRYRKTHPELFALQPDGTRSGFPNPHMAKLCSSNPKVWDLWLEGVAEQLEEDPGRTLFNASSNDGWASGHCVCPNCTAWDHPKGEPRKFNWKGKSEERPALSDREVTFANKLAELLEKKYPGKGYRVVMQSYGHSRPTPVAAKPADNVVMSVIANFLGRTTLVDRGSARGETFRQQFEAWAKVVPSMLWRPNTGSPAGWQQGLPDLSVRQTARDIKDVAAARCEGIFIDTVWEHWATQGPQYYVMAQLIWNPSADVEAVLDDYYRRGFGPAAGPVKEYFDAIEAARVAFTAKNPEAGLFAFPTLYTAELLKASQARLDRAAAAVPADSVYAKRVAFVRAGLTYTTLTVENICLMAGYWKRKDDGVAARVRNNWAAIEKLTAANPYAVNWRPVQPKADRTAGMHPDHPLANPKLIRALELDK